MTMNSRYFRTAAVLAGLLMVLPVCAVMSCSDADAEGTFEITDGTGKTFTFSGPAEHIVAQGAGTALTIADAGCVSKIVAVDKYSTYSYTKYEQLKDMKAVDLKSFYGTTNHEYILTELTKMVDEGKLDKHDPIILTSYISNLTLRTNLEKAGFDHVLVWTTFSTYDDIVDFVKDVSKIAAGTETESVKKMTSEIESVKDYVASNSDKKVKALYVYYYKDLKIGNTGIMKTMLDICSAENIGYDASKDASYGSTADIVSLLDKNRDAVVFVQNSYFNNHTLDDFYKDVLNNDRSIKVVQMGLHWNNNCPESAEGLKAIAEALYETSENGSGSPAPANYGKVITIVIVLVLALAIAGVAVRMKRPSSN